MKLIRTFEITSDEFYDYLEDKLLESIQKTTNRTITKNNIKSGYFFENPKARSKISIDKYQRGKIYQTTVHSGISFIRVTYETIEKKEGLEISFEEFVSGVDDEMEHKNKLYQIWHSWITFGRMSHTLYDMRNEIIEHRTTPQKG